MGAGVDVSERAGEPDEAVGPSMADVYARERDGLIRMAAFVTGDVHSAVDVVHEAFADLQAEFDAVDSPGAWLNRAVARRSVSWVRRRITARRYLQSQVRTDGPAGTRGDRAEMVDVATRLQVRSAIGRLSPQRRAVVFCRFYLDLSDADTAAMLGVPGTVKSRLSRALAELEVTLDG